jgi:hypothetical protein
MRIKWGSKQQDESTRDSYREQARAALTAAGFGVLRAQRDAALALCDESAHRFAGHSADLATAVRAALGVTTGTRDRGDVVTEPEIPDAADRAHAHAMRCIARMIETRAAAGLTEAHEAERAHVDRLINRLAAGVQPEGN